MYKREKFYAMTTEKLQAFGELKRKLKLSVTLSRAAASLDGVVGRDLVDFNNSHSCL
jgi:hypothetical protein